MNSLIVTEGTIVDTLKILQEAGRQRSERVLLWLAQQTGVERHITEIYVPEQQAARDYFRIPRIGISNLLQNCRVKKLKVVAQVHSHPMEAFHSEADDRWAIVRHTGALSLVLPYFSEKTCLDTFNKDVVVFELSIDNKWVEVPKSLNCNYIRIDR